MIKPLTQLSDQPPATVELFRTMVGALETDQGTAAQITHVLRASWAALQTYSGRELRHGTYTERIENPNQDCSVPVEVIPVHSINSFGVRDHNNAFIQFSSQEMSIYDVEVYSNWVAASRPLPARFSITYTAGWEDGKWPYDIVQANLVTAIAWYHSRGRNVAVSNESVDGVFGQSYTSAAIPKEAKELMDFYRLAVYY